MITPKWYGEIEQIYRDYTIYFQSEGVEQAVFDTTSGQAGLRSVRLLEALTAHVKIPRHGRLLDLGCGNGAMLRAMSGIAPGWALVGAELNDKNREVVESIERVEKLFTCEPQHIPGSFDLITIIHMLEHIPRPVEYLRRLLDKLKPDGLLLVQVPNYLQNPYDLLVADHSSHFSPQTASALVRSAGYQIERVATDWIHKELSIVARKNVEKQSVPESAGDSRAFENVQRTVQWLEDVVTTARTCAARGNFGIFGTSIAATWLFAEVGDTVTFFVDEDPSRTGKTFMGHAVLHPSEVSTGSHVFLALPRELAESVRRRLGDSGVQYHLPPCLEHDPHQDTHSGREELLVSSETEI